VRSKSILKKIMLELQPTADGSFTFFSTEFGQSFHSSSGAKEEAIGKFAKPTQLADRALTYPKIRIFDPCYGLGYNCAAALQAIWSANPQCPVEIMALEINFEVATAAIEQQLLSDWPAPIPALLAELAATGKVQSGLLTAQLKIGDARQTIQTMQGFQADAVFLDPFSPTVCPELWTVEFLQLVANCCAPQGLLATYSCAGAVRTALIAAGFTVGDTSPVGRKAPGTIASLDPTLIPSLSVEIQGYLQTRAGIPYRDPDLTDHAARIGLRRQWEQQESILESTSQWRKRHPNSLVDPALPVDK
jgi:tRNA U34 5-methylaminomethyl-2-thiouridine-forming methyltransferase MnmC